MKIEDSHKHTAAVRSLQDCAARIEALADAASYLGNEKLADKLSNIASSIEDSAKDADEAYHQAILDRFQDAQTNSAMMLTTILHLADVAKEHST